MVSPFSPDGRRLFRTLLGGLAASVFVAAASVGHAVAQDANGSNQAVVDQAVAAPTGVDEALVEHDVAEEASDATLEQPVQIAGPLVPAPTVPLSGRPSPGWTSEAGELPPEQLAPPLVDLTVQPDDLWDRLRRGFAMPDLDGPLVAARQNWYAARPQLLKTIFDRSRRYLYHIVEELEKRGMPTELALLPMVESAFNPMAYSRAHASGLWQFIPSTGRRYELEQNSWYDARRDILASTSAALDYLQFLYDMHGDWHLALASYNWGENAVARAIERNQGRGLPTDYMSLTMPSETRNYLPKLQALKNIVMNPALAGLELDRIPNEPYFVTVPKTPDIDIRLAAKLAEMPVAELIALNPAYNRLVMSAAPSVPNPQLVLPADRVDTFLTNLENHSEPLTSWSLYTLKKGDRLERLAAQHGISVDKLRRANGIGPRSHVGAGFQLLLPVKGSSAATEPLPAAFAPPTAAAVRTVIRKIVHIVKRGETLTSIAHAYKVTVDDLKRWNPISRVLAGQKITIEREVASRAPVRPASKRSKPVRRARTRG